MRNRQLVTPQQSVLLAARAHGLRAAPTATEVTLWQLLKAGQTGVAFKRQRVIGRYIVDFVAPARRLIVEVDGGVHTLRRAADARRDRDLCRLGYRVLRLDAELVRRAPEEAMARIREALGS